MIKCAMCSHFTGIAESYQFACANGHSRDDAEAISALTRARCDDFSALSRPAIIARQNYNAVDKDAIKREAAALKKTISGLEKLVATGYGRYLSEPDFAQMQSSIGSLKGLLHDLNQAHKLVIARGNTELNAANARRN